MFAIVVNIFYKAIGVSKSLDTRIRFSNCLAYIQMRIPQLNLKELLIGACIDDAKIFLLDEKFIDRAFTKE